MGGIVPAALRGFLDFSDGGWQCFAHFRREHCGPFIHFSFEEISCVVQPSRAFGYIRMSEMLERLGRCAEGFVDRFVR